jgi:hypothetical protein
MMRLQTALSFLVMSGALCLTACVPVQPIPPNPSNPIGTVAVLPLVNNTTDVDAPPYVREKIANELAKRFYVIKPINEVDQILKDRMGVTLGVQLDMTTPQKLGETLGVDGVFYGSLDDFGQKVTGIYNVKRVRIRAKLVNCKSSQTVWKNGIGVKSVLTAGVLGSLASAGASLQEKQETGEELKPLFGESVPAPWYELQAEEAEGMGGALAASLLEKVVTKAMKAPLKQETEAAVSLLLSGHYQPGGWFSAPVAMGIAIPSGPGTGDR